MPIIDTFAKRIMRIRNSGKPVIYKYDELPNQLRVQIAHILRDTIGVTPRSLAYGPIKARWRWVHDALAKERGEFVLGNKNTHENHENRCVLFLIEESDFDQVMSFVEIAFEFMDMRLRKEFFARDRHQIDGAIAELNQRFQEHAVGYQYQAGRIVRVDSQYLHAETVEATVSLLHDAGFAGALEEFMEAHKYYREGDDKAAIGSANKAFESTMKAICEKRGWDYGKGKATASSLIDTLLGYGLIPSTMESHFNGLRKSLQTTLIGLPTVRNKTEGVSHGQGAAPVDVQKHIVSYALHLAATNIVFLIEAHNASK